MMYRQMQAEEEAKIPERDEKELSEAFRLFDLNGDGFIEWDELKVGWNILMSSLWIAGPMKGTTS